MRSRLRFAGNVRLVACSRVGRITPTYGGMANKKHKIWERPRSHSGVFCWTRGRAERADILHNLHVRSPRSLNGFPAAPAEAARPGAQTRARVLATRGDTPGSLKSVQVGASRFFCRALINGTNEARRSSSPYIEGRMRRPSRACARP